MKKKNIILLGIVIVVLIILIVVIYLVRGKSLDTNSTLINNLYSYIGSNDLEVCSGLVMYDENLVNQDTLGDDTLLCMAFNLLDDSGTSVVLDKSDDSNTCTLADGIIFATDDYEGDVCSITKINYEAINEQYKAMYGNDIDNNETFQYNGYTICYYYEDAYYCGLSETYTYTIGGEPHSYRTIKSAYQKGDNIVIYDYMINVINDTCYTSYVGLTENTKCTNNYDSDNVTYSFLKKYGTLYKHTFNKNDDGYYWVESEPVE